MFNLMTMSLPQNTESNHTVINELGRMCKAAIVAQSQVGP